MAFRTIFVQIVLDQEDPLLLERQRKYIITNVAQATESFGNTKVSIGFYDTTGTLETAVTQRGAEPPPQFISIGKLT